MLSLECAVRVVIAEINFVGFNVKEWESIILLHNPTAQEVLNKGDGEIINKEYVLQPFSFLYFFD